PPSEKNPPPPPHSTVRSTHMLMRAFQTGLVALTFFAFATRSAFATPPNDDCINAAPLTGTGIFPFDLTTATTRTEGQAKPNCNGPGGTGIANDIWYCWTPPCSGLAYVNTCGLTNIDTKIAFYVGCSCPPGQALCCNDDGNCGLQAALSCEV